MGYFNYPPGSIVKLNRDSPQSWGLQAWAAFAGGLVHKPYWGNTFTSTVWGSPRITEQGKSYYSDGAASDLISTNSVKSFNPYQGTLVISIIPRVVSGPSSRSNFFGVFKVGSTAEYVGFSFDPYAWDKLEGIIREDTTYTYAVQLEPTTYTVDEFYLYAYKYKWDGATGYDVELHKFGGPTIYEYDSNNAITNSLMTSNKEMRVYRNTGFELDILDGRYYNYLVPEALLWKMFAPQTRWELYEKQHKLWIIPLITTPPVTINAFIGEIGILGEAGSVLHGAVTILAAIGELGITGETAVIATVIYILASTGFLTCRGLSGVILETLLDSFLVSLKLSDYYKVQLDIEEEFVVSLSLEVNNG